MKKLLALVLAISMLFVITACNGDPAELTMAQVIEKSNAAMSDITSAHISAAVAMDMSMGTQSASAEIAMECDVDMETNLYYATVDSTTNGENQLMDMYIRNGDTVDYYLKSNGQWIKMEGISKEALGGAASNSDVKGDFGAYFDMISASDASTFEIKEISGKQCYALSAPIKLSSLEEAKKFNIDSFISNFITDTDDAEAVSKLFDAMGDLLITVYVDCETFMPYGFTADFADMIAGAVPGATVNQAYSSAVYSDFNNVTVTIPEEALNGADLSAFQQA